MYHSQEVTAINRTLPNERKLTGVGGTRTPQSQPQNAIIISNLPLAVQQSRNLRHITRRKHECWMTNYFEDPFYVSLVTNCGAVAGLSATPDVEQ